MLARAFPLSPFASGRKTKTSAPCRSLRLFKWETCNSGIHRPAHRACCRTTLRVMRQEISSRNSSSIPLGRLPLHLHLFLVFVESSLALFRHARDRVLPRRACLDVARFILVPYFSYFTRNFFPCLCEQWYPEPRTLLFINISTLTWNIVR